MKKVAVTTTSFGDYDGSPVRAMEENGYEVIFNKLKRKMKQDEVIGLCQGAVGIIAGTEDLGQAVLNQLPGLRVISRCGAGLENIDLDEANKRGIKIFNTPDAPTRAVAELTVGLILDMLRGITRMDWAIRNGSWDKVMGSLIEDKRVGIVGFGRIGMKVGELLAAMGCRTCYYDPNVRSEKSGAERASLEDLLRLSDIVTIHAATKNPIIGKKEIGLMRKGSWLVNVSRGEALDEEALCEALQSGHLSGAALDVFKKEPYSGKLTLMRNVILTPHAGSYAREARVKMEMEAARNLIKGLS